MTVVSTGEILDVHPVRMRLGPRTITRVRVIWQAGRLYVATTPTDVRSFAASAAPVESRSSGGSAEWHATLDDGREATFTRKGCSSCGNRWGGTARSTLLERAQGVGVGGGGGDDD